MGLGARRVWPHNFRMSERANRRLRSSLQAVAGPRKHGRGPGKPARRRILALSAGLFLATFAAGLANPNLLDRFEASAIVPQEHSEARADRDACTAPLPPSGSTFTGIVRHVIDGDGFCVGESASPVDLIEVRLADFYAPELGAPAGREAKAALGDLALHHTVNCRAGKRSYDRVVSTCTIDGVSVGERMRELGINQGGRGWRQ